MSLPSFNRRSFLKTAAAVSVSPALFSRSAMAFDVPASDRVTIGFIGAGKQTSVLLPEFVKIPGFQVVAVCDVDQTRREATAKRTDELNGQKAGTASKGCTVHRDFRELLAQPDLDAVVVVTPDHWHAPIVIAAANAGKDIYCEKPLSETIHEAQAMTKAVRNNKRIFQTGSMQRSAPAFRWATEIVRGGVLGKIERVHAGFGGPAKACDLPEEEPDAGLDWKLWLGPSLDRPYNTVLSPRGMHTHYPMWRRYWEFGGGGVTDWGAHHMDITQWGLGMDDSGPVEVIPTENPLQAQSGSKLIYANGVEVTHVPENGITFFGANGELFVKRGEFKLTLNGKVVADFKFPISGATDESAELNQKVEAVAKELLGSNKPVLQESTNHYVNFLNSIRSRKDPICPVEVGAHTVNACHLLNFSYRYGERIQWDPATEQFTNGTGQNKWLTREYRDEWKVV
ncbi:MAG TPA: Gfo/Idh/MocA family oxidoreductase [Planctomicrobium sp.]|nr:Gfo/Idh/MocA family oxidoreductase [Planctomicrobium sp.]